MRLKLKNNSGKLFAIIVAIFALFIIYSLYYAPGADIED